MVEVAPKDLPYKRSDFKDVKTLAGLSYDQRRALSWHDIKKFYRLSLYDQNPMCWGCGKDIDSVDRATLDHIVPKSLGGRTRLMNLRLMHKRCNSARNNRLPVNLVINPLAYTPIKKHQPRQA